MKWLNFTFSAWWAFLVVVLLKKITVACFRNQTVDQRAG
jgi:hypothetical protein